MLNIPAPLHLDSERFYKLRDRQVTVIASLGRSDAELALKKRLEECLDRAYGRLREPCSSWACAYCGADHASTLHNNLVAISKAHRNPNGTFGVIGMFANFEFVTASGSLDSIPLEHAAWTYADDLRTITKQPVIAALNPFYFEDDDFGEAVVVSCGFVILGPIVPRLQEVLLEVYAEIALVERLTNPEQQLTSLIEPEASRMVTVRGASGQRHTGTLPLQRRHIAEIALWLDQYRLSDRLILKGFHLQGDQISPTPTRRNREDGE
jgi:hypothetical protein